jgi:hypothetical protein
VSPQSLPLALRRRLRPLRDYLPVDRGVAAWRDGYHLVAGALVLCGVLAMGRPFVARHGTDPPLPHTDSVILEYVGWFVARDHRLYADIWEIKPPVAFLPSYLFAHLTGTNMYAHHLLGIATTALAMAATAAFGARVVGETTDSPLGGLAVGVAFFALPDLVYRPWLGYKAKMLVFALGMGGVERAVRGRPRQSGLLAGLAVGTWQLAVIFPVVTLVYALRERSRGVLRDHAVGLAGAGAVVAATVLLYADPSGFVAQVVLVPLVATSESGGIPWNLPLYFPGDTLYWFGAAGVGGLALSLARPDLDAARPVALGGLLMGLIVAFVDFDGLWDLAGPLAFLAVGVGLVVGALPRRARLAAVVALGLTLAPAFAPSGFARHAPVDMVESDGLPPSVGSEREHVYWNAEEVDSCRFFGSRTQRSALRYYPDADTLSDAPCPDAGRYFAVLRYQTVGGEPPPGVNGTNAVRAGGAAPQAGEERPGPAGGERLVGARAVKPIPVG